MRERLLLALLITLTIGSTPMPLRGQSAPGWLEPYREPAARLIGEATGDTLGSIQSEIERYSVWPAQACCYMVGKQAILRARETAQQAMGDRFDLKGFHDAVVTNGATPLSVTAQIVEAWSRA